MNLPLVGPYLSGSGSTAISLAESGTAGSGTSGQSFSDWLNANAGKVAIGAGAFVLLLALRR